MAAELEKPLIVIVGPTASGKTGVAIEIAQRYDGEIIAGDSRTVYRDMDIATAKPTLLEQNGVKHFGLGLVGPTEKFTAAEFQKYARQKIVEIQSRGAMPILAGGTGLYIDGVIFDYQYPKLPTQAERLKFENMSRQELYDYCLKNNIELPINDKNQRHLVQAALHQGLNKQRRSNLISNTIVVGIATENKLLNHRIDSRIEQMFHNGVVDEAIALGKKYGFDNLKNFDSVYPGIDRYLAGEASLDEAKQAFMMQHRQLAKRQMTWLRRNPWIVWCSLEDTAAYLEQVLAQSEQI